MNTLYILILYFSFVISIDPPGYSKQLRFSATTNLANEVQQLKSLVTTLQAALEATNSMMVDANVKVTQDIAALKS